MADRPFLPLPLDPELRRLAQLTWPNIMVEQMRENERLLNARARRPKKIDPKKIGYGKKVKAVLDLVPIIYPHGIEDVALKDATNAINRRRGDRGRISERTVRRALRLLKS
jgi:hypothetical protein